MYIAEKQAWKKNKSHFLYLPMLFNETNPKKNKKLSDHPKNTGVVYSTPHLFPCPMGLEYGYLYEWLKFMVNVGKYLIHGAYGCGIGMINSSTQEWNYPVHKDSLSIVEGFIHPFYFETGHN